MEYYLFKANKGNKDYGVAVNVLNGEISGTALIEENPRIVYYFK